MNELRQELEARTLSPKGLKSQLIARLTKAIKTEAEKAEEEEVKKGDDPEPLPKQELEDKDDEKKKKEVKVQTETEECIIIYPFDAYYFLTVFPKIMQF